MKLIYLLTLLDWLFSFCGLTQAAEVHSIKIPNLISTAKELNNTGIIEVQSSENRFVYLKISNDHIDKLYPILKNDLPFIMRECLRKDNNVIGAHITLFEPENMTPVLWAKVQLLLGKKFDFTPEDPELLFIRKIKQNKNINQVWFVMSVSSPELYKALIKIDPNNPYFKQLHYSIALSTHVNGHCA